LTSSKEPIGSSSLAHARYLHSSGKGKVTVSQKTDLEPSDYWNQTSYSVEHLYEILPAYAGLNDVYITQNRFYGSRATNRIAELSALYSDLDFYKVSDFFRMPPSVVFEELAVDALLRAKIPVPSLAISTGRGLALVWRHEPVPGHILPKWARCQQYIFEALKELGADPGAKDAVRVMRLVGTYNSKSRTLVETIFENLDEVWEFGELAKQILPVSQEQFQEQQARRRKNGEKIFLKTSRRASKVRQDGEEGFTLTTLCKSRMEDLLHLMKLRGMEKLPPGQRDEWMFVAAVSLSYLMTPEALEKKMFALGREVADWSEAETRSCISTVLSRAHAAADGKTLEWQGQQRTTRYYLTNKEIIQRLRITPEEEAHLETIISKDTKQQRDRERKEKNRRSKGIAPRDEYLAEGRANRQHHRTLAKQLREQGMSFRNISSELGISHTQVKRLLESGKSEE
jgi:hypothetical protein